MFHGPQKPQLLTNQVAVSLSRPAPASRPLPTVLIAPQPLPGWCPNGSDNVRLVLCLFARFSYRLVLGMKNYLCHFNDIILPVKYNPFSVVRIPFHKEIEFGFDYSLYFWRMESVLR